MANRFARVREFNLAFAAGQSRVFRGDDVFARAQLRFERGALAVQTRHRAPRRARLGVEEAVVGFVVGFDILRIRIRVPMRRIRGTLRRFFERVEPVRDEATRRRSLRAASGASAGSDPEDVIGDMFGGSARAPTAPVELTLGSEQLVRVRPVLRLLSCSTAFMRATAVLNAETTLS